MKISDHIHQDIKPVLEAEKIEESSLYVRNSDLQIKCKDYSQALRIKGAGIWSAMSDVFRSENPADKGAFFVEIGLGAFDYALELKRARRANN